MATIEYLNKRVEGKEKEVAKLEKKLERILKAQATDWEVNPYYYSEYDLKYTTRDLDEARKALEDYKVKLQQAIEKANSRDVKVIIDFLTQWKDETRRFYVDTLPRFLEARAEYYAKDHEYAEWYNTKRIKATAEERKAMREERRMFEKAFKEAWGWFMVYVDHKDLDMDKLNKDLNAEADRKYDFIIERTNAIVGEITDASNLSVTKGELNGYITGTRGTAKIQTIGAGGWNIQRYHFRTLVKPMK